jgi:exodeoxyribonuclease VII large subunit
LGSLAAHLKQLSPLTILERGYAIVEKHGKIVKSPDEAPVGSQVKLRWARGSANALVTEIEKE